METSVMYPEEDAEKKSTEGAADVHVTQKEDLVSTKVSNTEESPSRFDRTRQMSSNFDMEALQNQKYTFAVHMAKIEQMMKRELSWLKRVVRKVGDVVMRCLVAHRGFHDVDDAVCRPIENTIAAFTQAWAEGVMYCECDVTVLNDGNVVLAHDANLTRLRISSKNQGPNSRTTERGSGTLANMDFGDVLRQPLKNGGNAPLLTNVLNHAKALNGKLVVELKSGSPGPDAVSSALVKLFQNDITSLDSIAVVMSFDIAQLQAFRRHYDASLPADRRPKVLLLTIAKLSDPVVDFEMLVEPDAFANLREQIGDLIDGVYMEWTPLLLGQAKESFKALCSEMMVGVWTYSGDEADNVNVAQDLVDCGAVFVNSDLPYSFLAPPPE